jgi:alpha-beta hydrolase superfamily lysophospholipase
MKVELVQVTTPDDVILAGALSEPSVETNSVPGVDIMIMLHGNSGNFYHPFYAPFAKYFSELGCKTLRVNSRGHDVVNRDVGAKNNVSAVSAFGSETSPYFGTALEHLDDCRVDLRAWIDFAWDTLGCRQILIWGHSRGAVKVAYYLGTKGDRRVKCGILASPPWFSYSRWMKSNQADLFQRYMTTAREYVDDGQPDSLMWVKIPMDYVSGAANYLDKYGPHERYNVITHAANVSCPVLAFTGTKEVSGRFAFDGLSEAFEDVHSSNPLLTHISVPDGDHQYNQRHQFVEERIMEWLREAQA